MRRHRNVLMKIAVPDGRAVGRPCCSAIRLGGACLLLSVLAAMLCTPGCSKDDAAPDSDATAASTSEVAATSAPAPNPKPTPPTSGLPELPDLTQYEPDIADIIRQLARKAEESLSADDIGRLGFLYHATARTRAESDRAKVCYELAKKKDSTSGIWPYCLGGLFLTRGSYERSRIEFSLALERNPDYHRTHYWLGEVELKREGGAEAQKHFKRYAELEPELADGYAGMAAAAVRLGDYATALEQLNKALDLEPGSAFVHSVYASYHEAKGETDLAAVEAGIAEELPYTPGLFHRDPYALELWRVCGPAKHALRKAEQLASSGDGESAVLLIHTLLEDYPDNTGLLIGAAGIYYDLNRMDDAEEASKKAIQIDPKQVAGYVILSQIANRQGRSEEALELADKALSIDDSFVAAHVFRGRALVSRQRYEDAVKSYRQALRLEPGNALHMKAIGESLQMLGEVEEAKKLYIQAIEIGETRRVFPPGLMPVVANLAQMEIADGNVETAIRHFDRVVRLNPGRDYAFQQLVDLLVSVNRTRKAVEYCRSLTEQFPQSIGYGVTLADLLAKMGDAAGAEEQLRKVEKRFPDHPAIPSMRARILARNGDVDGAKAELKKAITLQPQYSLAYLLLSKVEVDQGRSADAIEALRAGLARAPGSATLANGLAWLLATTADESVRNPDEAIRLAMSAWHASGRRNPNYLDTLACACAAAGRFEDAVAAERQAIDLAVTRPYGVVIEEFQARLELFKNKQPFVEGGD